MDLTLTWLVTRWDDSNRACPTVWCFMREWTGWCFNARMNRFEDGSSILEDKFPPEGLWVVIGGPLLPSQMFVVVLVLLWVDGGLPPLTNRSPYKAYVSQLKLHSSGNFAGERIGSSAEFSHCASLWSRREGETSLSHVYDAGIACSLQWLCG